MAQRPKLSRIVASQLPGFIRDDYPTFVAFLEAYYEYLEQNDANLYELRDIDKTLDRFIEYFRNEVSPAGFESTNIDERFFLSNIKDAHLAKGSEASFKLLFRLLYNKNVTVEYPGRQILRASDGKWNQDVSVFARVNAGNPNDIVGKLVDVITPNRIIRVLVDRRQDVEIEVDRFVQISPDTYEFYVDRRFFGDISVGDRLRYEGIFDATIVATTSKLEVLQKGKNFRAGQLYPIKNGNGNGSIVKIKNTDTNGGILSAEYIKYGIGYETDFTATILPEAGQTTTGAGQTALGITTISSAVTSIEIISGGSGYTTPPTVALSGGGFTTAATIGEVTIVAGVITNIKVANPGSGYVTAPTVIIVGGSGTGASATSNIGVQSGYSIFETTNGFNEQGFINKFDYALDTPIVWAPNTFYQSGAEIYWVNSVYVVTTSGVTGSTPPTHTSGSVTNGTVTLSYNRIYGAAFEGAYSGEILREFFYDSKDVIINPEDPAIFRVSLGPLTKYPGYYRNNDGFLDDAIFIQDSRYYQAYSYVLKIDERLESYKSIVKTLIHPSGLALFGEYDIRNEFDISISLQSMLKILVVNAQDEVSLTSSVSKVFGKSVQDQLSFQDYSTKRLSKPLAHSVTTSEVISKKDFNKTLTDATLGFSEVTTFSINKQLADTLSTPFDIITAKDFGKALTDSVTSTENHVKLVSKPLFDTLNTPTDGISTKGLSKSLNDSVSTSIDVITSKDFGKVSSDSISISDIDTLAVTKYTSDVFTPLDDGGFIVFNPYDEGAFFEEIYVGARITF